MITAIMPTMWKGKQVLSVIQGLLSQETIGELIIIDNSDKVDIPYPLLQNPRITYLKELKNIYVNPSWNKGAGVAKYEKLLIVNDDVDTDWSFVNHLDEMITEDKGMIGAGVSCWQYNEGWEGSGGVVPISHRPNCYGCVFAIHKNSYVPIPHDLLIHYGDDWLFNRSGKQNYEIINWKMSGESEQTSGLKEFDTVKLVDKHNWFNKYR